MGESSDAQLLREYAEHGSEPAFREIVLRHADIVYASALRQVGNQELARDVAQSVFIDLSRKAGAVSTTLEENASLLGWLYRGTRFAALVLARNERRRQNKERRLAMDPLNTSPEPALEWEQVSPMLDEAMADLAEADREAILLRFFKNLDFRAVGSALGISDDAAQKRVSRALERLRSYLARRGVTTTAVALSAALSVHAAPAAPVGLAVAMAAGVLSGSAIASASTFTLIKTMAMTTTQKAVLGTALAAAVGFGIYQTHRVTRLHADLGALDQAQAPTSERLRQLSDEAEVARSRIAALESENQSLRNQTEELPRLRGELARFRADNRAAPQPGSNADTAQIAAQTWLDRVSLLKQRLEQMPQARIPELQLATDRDWLDAAKGDLNDEQDYRRALSYLRNIAENKFVDQLQPALKKYLDANNGKFPTDTSQLQPYFSTPVGPALLQHWQVAPSTDLSNLGMGGEWILTEASVVDEKYDQRRAIGPNGSGTTFSEQPPPAYVLAPALKAYLAANNGSAPDDPAQLQPFANTVSQRSALQHLQEQFAAMAPDEKARLLKSVQLFK
jgi:RNA polymerase sigma factor (sigma-70 family)